MAYLRIFTIAAVLTVACCFTPNLRKENEDIDKDEYKGKTAWIKDLPVVEDGAFAAAMCVDAASGALIDALYDNPGVVRIDPGVTGSVLSTELAELPYPTSIVCDGAGNAYVASSVSPSAVAAVALSSNKELRVKTEPTFLPDGCGGVLAMKYSKRLDVLVASCGSAPATVVRIDIDKSDSELYVLTPGDLKLVRGASARGPWGLAVYDTADASFVVVGLSDGMLVKLSLPTLAVVEQIPTPGKRLGMFSVGNNGKTLMMFSPFPWRRVMIMDLSKPFTQSPIVSSGLDQDLEFVTDLHVAPDSTTAYIIGNSQRKVPAILQMDTTDPLKTWGIILAGVCNKEEETAVSWCEWGPKGRTAQAVAFDIEGPRANRMYIGVSAKYCAHCQEWHKDNDKRCKDGEEEEDYYDDKTYCLHEEWNQRRNVYAGDVGIGIIDEKSNKAWGGDNTSVVLMQLGSIPNIGGVAAASGLEPWLRGVFFVSLAATTALLHARAL